MEEREGEGRERSWGKEEVRRRERVRREKGRVWEKEIDKGGEKEMRREGMEEEIKERRDGGKRRETGEERKGKYEEIEGGEGV